MEISDNRLVIEVSPETAAILSDALRKMDTEFQSAPLRRFDGIYSLVSLFVPFTSLTIAIIGKILVEEVKSRRHIRVKYKGYEISGLSSENTLKLLSNLLQISHEEGNGGSR